MYKVLHQLITVRATEREEFSRKEDLKSVINTEQEKGEGAPKLCLSLLARVYVPLCVYKHRELAEQGCKVSPRIKAQLNQNVFLRNILLANYEESN